MNVYVGCWDDKFFSKWFCKLWFLWNILCFKIFKFIVNFEDFIRIQNFNLTLYIGKEKDIHNVTIADFPLMNPNYLFTIYRISLSLKSGHALIFRKHIANYLQEYILTITDSNWELRRMLKMTKRIQMQQQLGLIWRICDWIMMDLYWTNHDGKFFIHLKIRDQRWLKDGLCYWITRKCSRTNFQRMSSLEWKTMKITLCKIWESFWTWSLVDEY